MTHSGEKVPKLINKLKELNSDESHNECDPIVEGLVLKAFATMVCFQNLFDQVQRAFECNDASEIP
jgi:hypothetical protein